MPNPSLAAPVSLLDGITKFFKYPKFPGLFSNDARSEKIGHKSITWEAKPDGIVGAIDPMDDGGSSGQAR
jgi:hypothetical protein